MTALITLTLNHHQRQCFNHGKDDTLALTSDESTRRFCLLTYLTNDNDVTYDVNLGSADTRVDGCQTGKSGFCIPYGWPMIVKK